MPTVDVATRTGVRRQPSPYAVAKASARMARRVSRGATVSICLTPVGERAPHLPPAPAHASGTGLAVHSMEMKPRSPGWPSWRPGRFTPGRIGGRAVVTGDKGGGRPGGAYRPAGTVRPHDSPQAARVGRPYVAAGETVETEREKGESAERIWESNRRVVLEAHRRLMRALLEEALACFQKHVLAARGAKRRLFVEAERWLMGREKRGAGITFQHVCDSLDLEPSGIQRALRSWRDRRLEERAQRGDADELPDSSRFIVRRWREPARAEPGGRRARGKSGGNRRSW